MSAFRVRLAGLSRRAKILLAVAGALLLIAAVVTIACLASPDRCGAPGDTVRSRLFGGANSGKSCHTCCGNCALQSESEKYYCYDQCEAFVCGDNETCSGE